MPDGGGMRWARRILRMVEAATRRPSRRSSPWILTTPHRVFSRARRRISATSSSGTGGRPGGLGWRHFAATRRRCQRSSVPGVTIRAARSAFGIYPGERGEHGPGGPGHARPGVRPAQHGHLVPQREYLRVLGRRGPGQQREPGQHGHQQPVRQRDTHECRSCRCRSPRSNQRPKYSTTTGSGKSSPPSTSASRPRSSTTSCQRRLSNPRSQARVVTRPSQPHAAVPPGQDHFLAHLRAYHLSKSGLTIWPQHCRVSRRGKHPATRPRSASSADRASSAIVAAATAASWLCLTNPS